MAKKVTVPKTHSPGRGRPKEKLAYLNEREMAYLRSLNGNNIERGPKGIPSFADDSASSRGVSRGDSSGTRGSSGDTSGVGGGGGGGGGSTGSRGSSTSSVGSRSGSEASGNKGGLGGGNLGGGNKGGQKGPGGPSGPNSGPSRSSQSVSRSGGPSGPSGPNSSASKSYPSRGSGPARSFDTDTAARQKAETINARATVSNKALANDLRVGGIKTLNVGPMSMPVTVATRPVMKLSPITRSPTLADRVAQSAADVASYLSNAAGSAVQSVFGDVFKTKADGPLGYGAYEQLPQVGVDNVPKGGRMLGLNAYDRVPTISAVTTPQPTYKYSEPAGPPTAEEFRQSEINRLAEEIRLIYKYGPDPTPTGNPNMIGARLSPSPTVGPTNGLPSPSVPMPVRTDRPYDIRGTRVTPGEERVIRIENVPAENERPTYAAGTYTSPYDNRPREDYSSLYKAASEALDPYYNAGANQFRSLKGEIGGVYSPDDEFSQSAKIPNWSQGSVQRRTRSIGTGEPQSAPDEAPKTTNGYSQNPMQDGWGDIQLEKSGVQKKFEDYGGWPGKAVKLASFLDNKLSWENMTPEERLASLERRNEIARQYGRGPGATSNQGQLPRPEPMSTGGGGGGGGTGPVTPPTPTETTRPAIYYMWDVGVSIPSPGDSNYTLYQQYLAERQAANG